MLIARLGKSSITLRLVRSQWTHEYVGPWSWRESKRLTEGADMILR